MKWRILTAVFVLALVALTAGVSTSQPVAGKTQGKPEMKADVTIESGAEGLRIVAEFESGRVEIERRGEPMTVKISGLDVQYADNVVGMLLSMYRQTQQTTRQASLDSSGEYRRLREDNKRLESNFDQANEMVEKLTREAKRLEAKLAEQTGVIREFELRTAKQREVIEYLEAAVKKSRESDG